MHQLDTCGTACVEDFIMTATYIYTCMLDSVVVLRVTLKLQLPVKNCFFIVRQFLFDCLYSPSYNWQLKYT